MKRRTILESIEKDIRSVLEELEEEKMHKKFCTLVEEALKDEEPEEKEEEESEPILKLDTARIVKGMDYFSCLKVSREIEDIVLDSITNYLNENDGTASDEDIKNYLQTSWPELIQAIYERGTSDEVDEGEEVEEVEEVEDEEEGE